MTRSARGSNPTSRRLPAVAGVLVLLAALVWPVPVAASAADPWSDLQTDLAPCTGDASIQVTLTGDISETGSTVTVGCVLEIDLDGHDMAVRNVAIQPGRQLTVVDGSGGGSLTADASAHSQVAGILTTGATLIVQRGTVTATGGFHSAGIGGGLGGAGGSVTIAGGTVAASGGMHGAGIGGGQGAAGGPVTIAGGTVTATGSGHAAGIGGGYEGAAGGPVTIAGGTVTATGIGHAAGIGGGIGRAGGDVQIDAGAVVTATGGHTAIGAGQGSSSFGSLAVAGTLRLPDGSLRIPVGVVVSVADSGRILGGTDPVLGANVLGDGRIDNGGVIGLRASLVTADNVTVSGHHYQVVFDAAGGRPEPEVTVVFAPSFDTGMRPFPADPTREDGQAFICWTDQPHGAGDPFTAASTLPGTSDDGTPVEVTVAAFFSELTVESGWPEDAVTITAGEDATFTPRVSDRNGELVTSDPAGWTIGDADGHVDTNIDPDGGLITLASTTAGTHVLQLHVPAGGGTGTATLTLHVEPAETAVLQLDVVGTTLVQGDQVTITVTGTDEHANPTGDLTDEITFTSDVATDLIDGNTITFPTASPHTITATHVSGVTATLVFEITPDAADTDDETRPDDETPPDDEPPRSIPGLVSTDQPPSTTPFGVATDQATSVTAAVPAAAEGSLADTGANPFGLIIAALLMSLGGTLLLRRSAATHQGSPVDPAT